MLFGVDMDMTGTSEWYDLRTSSFQPGGLRLHLHSVCHAIYRCSVLIFMRFDDSLRLIALSVYLHGTHGQPSFPCLS